MESRTNPRDTLMWKPKWKPYDGLYKSPFWVAFWNSSYQCALLGVPLAATFLIYLGHPYSALAWIAVWLIGMSIINFWKTP